MFWRRVTNYHLDAAQQHRFRTSKSARLHEAVGGTDAASGRPFSAFERVLRADIRTAVREGTEGRRFAVVSSVLSKVVPTAGSGVLAPLRLVLVVSFFPVPCPLRAQQTVPQV